MAVVAAFAVFLCLTQRADAAPSGVPLIIDTDIFHNADDVGALASAFALQQKGEANVIAITANSPTYRSAVATDSWKCIAAIANFYGSNVPIGSQMPDNGTNPGTGTGAPDDLYSRYVTQCAGLAPPSTPAPSPAVEVLRRALASQPGTVSQPGSVVLAELGYQQNLEDLLKSQPDAISSMSGFDLVKAKVSMLAVTGGFFPSSPVGGAESNLEGNGPAANYVAANWPTKIVWSGDEVGNNVATGYTLPSKQPANSPVRVSYQAFVASQFFDGPNIPSYDLTTIYHAIRPADTALVETGPGTNAVDSSGNNTFTSGPGNQFYLTLDPADVPTSGGGQTPLENSIESLLGAPAPTGTVSGTVTDASTGAPIAGVAVHVADQFGNPLPGTTTAADGTYTLSGLHGGAYAINFVPGAGYQPGSSNGEVSPSPDGTLSGVVNAALTVTPPSNTGLPSISGSAVGGKTLTESHGVWTNNPTSYSYQWEDCDASGNNCWAIAGATSPTYTLTAGDVGHTIRVEETAIKETVPSLTAAPSPATAVVGLPPAPSSIGPPSISGPTTQGQMLTESHGAWAESPTDYSYQWEDCDQSGGSCYPISGATSQTYTLSAGDVSHTVRVREWATNMGGTGIPASSAATGVVQSSAVPTPHLVPSNSSPPVISGTPTVGRTLTSSSGAWSGTAPVTYVYQWERCARTCAAIPGATRAGYRLTRADSGAKIVVRVTATDGAGSTSATSAPAGPVALAAPTRGQVRAALRRGIVVSGKAARIRRLLARRGYTARFAAPATGHLVITWYAVPTGAHHRVIVVAVARVTFHHAGKTKVRITLTRRGRTRLERSTRLRVIVKARFTPRGQTTTTTTRTIHLRR